MEEQKNLTEEEKDLEVEEILRERNYC